MQNWYKNKVEIENMMINRTQNHIEWVGKRWTKMGRYQLRDNFNRQHFKKIKSVKN